MRDSKEKIPRGKKRLAAELSFAASRGREHELFREAGSICSKINILKSKRGRRTLAANEKDKRVCARRSVHSSESTGRLAGYSATEIVRPPFSEHRAMRNPDYRRPRCGPRSGSAVGVLGDMSCGCRVLACLLLLCAVAPAEPSRRSEALAALPPLVYPSGGSVKLLAGIAVPIALPGRILVYAQNLQVQYPLPQNASSFPDYFGRRRRRREAPIDERATFYQLLAQELQRRGAASGEDCVRRSICEAAETPLLDDGLLGELLHLLLTPDYGGSLTVGEEYLEAAEIGRSGGDCSEAFPLCLQGYGLLDRISTVFHD